MTAFVPASRLYDAVSQTPIAHPATQATDDDVRRALEAFQNAFKTKTMSTPPVFNLS